VKSKSGKNVLVFNEDEHVYILNGVVVPGVTSIQKGSMPASPQLEGWKIKMVADSLLKQIQELSLPITEWNRKALDEIAKKAKQSWKVKAQEAADIGTIVHDYMEAVESGIAFDLSFLDAHPDKEKVLNCIQKADEWRKQNNDKIIAQEGIVGSVGYGYAGKFDRLAKRGSRVVLSDFKTSKAIYPSYFVQLGAYDILIDEWLNVKVDAFEIIRIGKEDGSFEVQMKDDPLELVELREQFVRQLETYNFYKGK
jgi:hypothetical protein